MTKRNILIVFLTALLVTLVATFFIYRALGVLPAEVADSVSLPMGAADSGALAVSGFVETEQIEIAVEMGGRVVELPFAEGDQVSAGDTLLRLDTSVLEAQRGIAEAQLNIAVAQRDLLEATPREEVIRQAQAQVSIAQASVDAAEQSLADAAALANNPQDLQIQVVDAQTQLAVANEQLAAAQVQFTAADAAQDYYYFALDQLDVAQEMAATYGLPEPGGLPLDMTLSPQRYQQASINLSAAQEAVADAQALLETLEQFADNPAALQAQVASAQAQVQTSQASLERAQAELEALKAGPGPEDLAVADAQIAQAQAVVDVIQARIDRMTITAPIGGLIMEQSVHVGELAAPGVPLIVLANLDSVELTVYIPEDRLNEVSLNQAVEISVDSFPGEVFQGTVAQIADRAEFTPRGVQTREERVNLVFAVTIRIDNPDLSLKPGMPADARFE